MKTSCQLCCFADYLPDTPNRYGGNTQVGCNIGKLETLKSNGVKILEAHDLKDEFYLIDGHCHFFRTKEWGAKQEDKYEAVHKENRLKWQAVVMVGADADISQLSKTIESIKLQTLPPEKVFVVQLVRCKLPITVENLVDMMGGLKWSFVKVHDESLDDGHVVATLLRHLTVYGIYFSGFEFKDNDQFNKISLNLYDGKTFIMLRDDGPSNTIVDSAANKTFGNTPTKIYNCVKGSEWEKQIINLKDFVS